MGRLGTRSVSLRLLFAIALVASFLSVPAVSAQQEGMFRGTYTFVPPAPESDDRRGYTATDDLWTWREGRDRITIQTGRIVSELEFDEGLSHQPFPMWDSSSGGHNNFQMQLNWYVPDLDSDSSGMLTSITGKADGRIQFLYRPGPEQPREPGAVTWTGKVEGEGICDDDVGECTVNLVITGRLGDPEGRGNCGDFSLQVGSVINPETQTWTFVDPSTEGTEEPSRVVTDLRASKKDGLHCYIGETEKGVRSAEIAFYFGEPAEPGVRPEPYDIEPDRIVSGRTTRVMPGDNIKMYFSDIPMQIQERTNLREGESLLGPGYSLVGASYDLLEIDLRFGGRGDEVVRIGGEISGHIIVLDQDLEHHAIPVQGQISGEGSYNRRADSYGLRISGDLILIDRPPQFSRGCGSMAIDVGGQLRYDEGPKLTLMPNGTGSITADVTCVLDTMESWEDI